MDSAAQPTNESLHTSVEAPKVRNARPILASLASTLFPGAGQFMQGRTRAAAVWFGIFAALVGSILLLRVDSTYAGFMIWLFALMGLNVASGCNAFWCARNTSGGKRPAFLILLPIASGWVLGSIVGALLLFASGFTTLLIPSTGMFPTIEKGDRIVVDSRAYTHGIPKRGDVVIVKRNGLNFVKRVIGLPVETVSITGGAVSINGHVIKETYILLNDTPDAYGREFAATVVPPGYYFVLGDNRDLSRDSRDAEFGMIGHRDLVGKALYIWRSQRAGRRSNLRQLTFSEGVANP